MIISFPQPDIVLNANQRLHWSAKANRVQAWRYATFVAARQKRIKTATQRCLVGISLPVASLGTRRDGANWHPTLKAAIDGLVDAKVFIDDSTKYVKTDEPTFHLASDNLAVVVTITEIGPIE